VLDARALRKTYGGVVALAGADFTVRAGSVHALLGENGAGKSTLVKIVAGAIEPDTGELRLDGRPVRFANTAEAARSGVAVVSQELNLFGDLDVLGNLFTLREIRHGPFISRAEMARKARPCSPSSGSTCRCARAWRTSRWPSGS
jgi:ABC-type sugar transport system ATPase subunit